MKKESLLVAVIALIIGLLVGYLVFSIFSDRKNQQAAPTIPSGSGSTVDYNNRIAEAEKIVAKDPKNVNAWMSLGNDYFDTDQPQKAVNAYSKVLELQPNSPDVLTDQGVMYRKLGWYDKALENFAKAQQIDPKHLQSLFNAGIVYAVDLKDHVKARPYWKKILEIDPNSPVAMQVKGMMQGGGGAPMPPVTK